MSVLLIEVPKPEFVYRLISQDDWRQAQAERIVAYQAIDQQDGFLHLSVRDQVLDTAALYFKDRDDLLALEISYQKIAQDLKFEPSRDGVLFPHLYGQLSVAAITRAIPLIASTDGDYQLDEEVDK